MERSPNVDGLGKQVNRFLDGPWLGERHLPGRETRMVPMFSELKPYLQESWDAAEKGSAYLVPRLRAMSGNLSSQLLKYIRRAGLEAWPRLWQNLRASRATELADAFPSHVAAAWLGHTSEIADRHYRSVTEAHFQRAIEAPCSALQIPVQSAASEGQSAGQDRTEESEQERESPVKQALPTPVHRGQNCRVGATGFEPVTSTV